MANNAVIGWWRCHPDWHCASALLVRCADFDEVGPVATASNSQRVVNLERKLIKQFN
jgi:hypothetical protein